MVRIVRHCRGRIQILASNLRVQLCWIQLINIELGALWIDIVLSNLFIDTHRLVEIVVGVGHGSDRAAYDLGGGFLLTGEGTLNFLNFFEEVVASWR
jgi:hypothetical protein